MNHKRMYLLFFISIWTILLIFACTSRKQNAETTVSQNAESENSISVRTVIAEQTFDFKFFAHIFDEEAAGEDNNFMVSPLSLSMALAMVSNGTESETKKEIKEALGTGSYSDDEMNAYYRDLRNSLLQADSTVKISIANSIWTNKTIPIYPDFISTNQKYYDAVVESADFADPATVKRVNKWASENTSGLIDDVMEKTDTIDLMYLLNAIYFKAAWEKPFDKVTSPKPFTYENGTQKQVAMMKIIDDFSYGANETLQIVNIPYGNKAFNMKVLLPKIGKKLNNVVDSIMQPGYWKKLDSIMQSTSVELTLPKFKIEYSKELNNVLKKMGIKIAFTDSANFNRMSGEDAFISLVKQDTYINTDESGTEAAAVTSVVIRVESAPYIEVIFNANRPFLYVIQENSTGAILFMGAVKNFEE